jgi:small GTP-binding protein
MNNNPIKCVIIGDACVGKTSIIQKYLKKEINNTNTTLGAVFWTFNHENIKINLWDTAGQERYLGLIPMYTRNADIILFTFDLTNKDSFINLEKWINKIDESCIGYKLPIRIFIGNKKDKPDFRCVTDLEIRNFLFLKNINSDFYFETSALTGENIDDIFKKVFKLSEEISRKNRERSDSYQSLSDINIKIQEPDSKINLKCCNII